MGHLVARETIHLATKSGIPRTISAGSGIDANDPAVKASPWSFATAEQLAAEEELPTFEADVEQATAAPGEKRPVRRRATS